MLIAPFLAMFCFNKNKGSSGLLSSKGFCEKILDFVVY